MVTRIGIHPLLLLGNGDALPVGNLYIKGLHILNRVLQANGALYLIGMLYPYHFVFEQHALRGNTIKVLPIVVPKEGLNKLLRRDVM